MYACMYVSPRRHDHGRHGPEFFRSAEELQCNWCSLYTSLRALVVDRSWGWGGALMTLMTTCRRLEIWTVAAVSHWCIPNHHLTSILLMDKILHYPFWGICHNSHSSGSLGSCRILSINSRSLNNQNGVWGISYYSYYSYKVRALGCSGFRHRAQVLSCFALTYHAAQAV